MIPLKYFQTRPKRGLPDDGHFPLPGKSHFEEEEDKLGQATSLDQHLVGKARRKISEEGLRALQQERGGRAAIDPAAVTSVGRECRGADGGLHKECRSRPISTCRRRLPSADRPSGWSTRGAS